MRQLSNTTSATSSNHTTSNANQAGRSVSVTVRRYSILPVCKDISIDPERIRLLIDLAGNNDTTSRLAALLDFYSDRAVAHASFFVASVFGTFSLLFLVKNWYSLVLVAMPYSILVLFGIYSLLNFGKYASLAEKTKNLFYPFTRTWRDDVEIERDLADEWSEKDRKNKSYSMFFHRHFIKFVGSFTSKGPKTKESLPSGYRKVFYGIIVYVLVIGLLPFIAAAVGDDVLTANTFAFLAPYLMVIISVVVLAAIVVLVVVSFVLLKRGEI